MAFWKKILIAAALLITVIGGLGFAGYHYYKTRELRPSYNISQGLIDDQVNKKSSLIVFYKNDCPRCKSVEPTIRIAEFKSGIFGKVDIYSAEWHDSATQNLINRFNLQNQPMPIFVVIKDGRVVLAQTGTNKEGIKQIIQTGRPGRGLVNVEF